MKIKEGFVLRHVAGTDVVLPISGATLSFRGMLTLNETGSMIWRLLEEGATRDELANAVISEYEVSAEEALADVDKFIAKLCDAGCLDTP
ncbi:MAG: PqqD family protein [Clostridia bacterium]|nr:PqqD family protein [Clostridia bacterium]